MFWIKLSILIIGFSYAVILPYTIYKVMKSLEFNPRTHTLSYISIKEIYGKKYHTGYTYLLFLAAILNYAFFWLLTEIYDLYEFDDIVKYIDSSCFFLVILSFIPFNLVPYKKENIRYNLKRIFHNIFAAFVFVSLTILIIIFNLILLGRFPLLSIIGFIIIGITMILLFIDVKRNSITGFSELLFIDGLSLWSIFVTVFTVLK